MRISLLIFFFLITFKSKAQEGIPIYFDYLTENYYLVHPSMAGVNLVGGKIRTTVRKQWFDQVEAPNLQTLTADLRVSERSGVGMTKLTNYLLESVLEEFKTLWIKQLLIHWIKILYPIR